MRTLTLGDRGKEVSDVQKRLHALGYELGREGIDGFFGPRSQVALKGFQQERGLLVDGVLGANAWRELVEAGYALGDRLLYLRMPAFRGDDVLALQVKLNLFGFNAGPERGIFDAGVERAVIEFQRNAGLPVDGIVGEATLSKLDALRKAESGREGKKIPERDEGFARHDTLAGVSVVVDPGHGGQDVGVTGRDGVREKDLALTAGLRLAELLRAEGARVTLTRDSDQTVPLYVRAEAAEAAAADYFLALHFAGHTSAAAGGATCYFFQRSHYFSEHGARLADYIGGEVATLGVRYNASLGRNFAVLREPPAIAVLVEPLFLDEPGRVGGRRPLRLRRPAGERRRGRAGGLPGTGVSRVSAGDASTGAGRVGANDMGANASVVRSFTVTQAQRLRELGAAEAKVVPTFASAADRDAAYRILERELADAGRRQLEELRSGPRTPLLRRLETTLRDAVTDIGFVEVATPAIIAAEALDKMGVTSGDPLRDQVFWVERDRCLRPMLAPNLYTVMRRLGRTWPRPFGIFEIGSCWRRDSKGGRHLNEFTMMNLVELGTAPDDRDARLRALVAAVMKAAGLDDYELEATESEVYGTTLDVVAGGIEVCSTAVGPLPLDDAWAITEPWVGLGFGLERLLLVREGDPGGGAIERFGRSVNYLDGVRLHL